MVEFGDWTGSQRALLARFATLVKDARVAEAELLVALREVDDEKLYAVAGFGSLFAFCVEAHGMSEARAAKRIRAARLAGRHPRLLGMLRRGELRLGGIHVLGRLLDGSEDPGRVLDRARGKTVRQLEALTAELRPRPDVPSSVRRLPAPRAAPRTASNTASKTAPRTASNRHAFPSGGAGACGDGSAPERAVEPGATPSDSPSPLDAGATRVAPVSVREKRAPDPQPLRPGRFRVTVTLDEETVVALRELQDLSAHEQPNRDPASLIAKAIRLALAEKRRAVRKERKTNTKASERKTGATEQAVSRRASAAVVREVWARDGGRCTYVAPGGRRCAETACL